MAHVRIEAVSPEITPPPPILPTKVPTHLKHHQTAKAAKTTWFMETKRADITGKEVSDEKLNVLYKAGRKWYLQHATKPEVREASVPAALTLAYALTTADARASQTKSYMNAHQKQSFDEQLAQGQQPTSAPMRTHPYLSTATHGSPPTCRSQVAGCGEHALVGGAYCTLKRRILPMWAELPL